MKKVKLLIAVGMITAAFFVMQSSAPPPPTVFDVNPQALTLRQTPPQINDIWVQKLINPPATYNMRLSMALDSSYCFETITDTLDIYWGDSATQKITFFDNGTNADNVPHDGIYSAFVLENIANFRSEMIARDAAITANGGFIEFTGHSGQRITEIEHFDVGVFDGGTPAKIPSGMFKVRLCETIKRENSLFITDLSVVANIARTYNPATATGNIDGKWTFGQMFKNMTGTTGIPVKNLLKSWVKNWTQDITVNYQTVEKRGDVFELLIAPWLRKAGATIPAGAESASNWDWESAWDQTAVTGENLCKYAPFKLTAIVNRIDLKENTLYYPSILNSGETRFIFTLIDYSTGNVPKAIDPNRPAGAAKTIDFEGFIDWEGMNVIFEYGNVETTRCGLKSLAERWVHLSDLTLGGNAYLEALEDITDDVTLANAAPGRVNGSAVNRIRTNEKIFFESDFPRVSPDPHEFTRWTHSDWEFRQFELDAATGLFKQVPVTNTPNNFLNKAITLSCGIEYFFARGVDWTGCIYERVPDASFEASGRNLAAWMTHPAVRGGLLRGNHNLPNTYMGSFLAGGAGLVVGEFSHYWSPALNATGVGSALYTDPAKWELRHQLSLNTCEGCHNGETKTIFTHIRTMSNGETANYWQSPTTPPSSLLRFVDNSTEGEADVPVNVETNLYPDMSGKRYFQSVSAFLTGVAYRGVQGSPTYQDDDPSDAGDDNMEGLFYVNDPSHASANPAKFGYNDLLRRRDILCGIANGSCGIFRIIDMVQETKHVPLPLGAH
ncbi:hypothetical protein [Rurimicrobium arvi]|uniref:Uncharacterized protein n=1 Tax=Rurimicrobium arvi TaxID=2049916 RepID=A0ABP8MFE6_9BACT